MTVILKLFGSYFGALEIGVWLKKNFTIKLLTD